MVKEFNDFSKSIHSSAQKRADFILQNWNRIISSQNNTLNSEITKLFNKILKIENKTLNSKQSRKTTIKSTIFEIYIGSLIKELFEQKYSQLKVLLNTHIRLVPKNGKSFSVYPDIQICKNDKLIGIVELKFNLKLNQYNSEIKRLKKIISVNPNLFFSHLVFEIYDKSMIQQIINDKSYWLYIMNFRENAENHIRNNEIKYPSYLIETLIFNMNNFLKALHNPRFNRC